MPFEIRNAKLREASEIASLISSYSSKNLMLSRTAESVVEEIRNFIVAEYKGKIAGCCAVSFFTEDLAEIRSVAVDRQYKGKGIGSGLISKAEEILRDEGIKNAFVLTYVDDFFSRLGYIKVDKSKFPQKIWRDCLSCPKITQCDEIAMEKSL
ncbi:MAG: N-acetyltransferase [Brevinematales bacterium]